MQLRSYLIVSSALVLALACSANTRDQATAAGGNGSSSGAPGNGGSAANAGASDGNAGSGGSAVSSAGMAGALEDDAVSVPAGLANTLLDGEVPGGLTLIAFTLGEGASGLELDVAVRNDGQTPACEAGITTYFYDQSAQLITTVGTVLQSRQFYRLSDDTVIPCLDPGQIAMGGSTALPATIVLGELGALEHAFPAFMVDDIVAVDALTVGQVQVVNTVAGSAYTGSVANALDTALSNPSVAIFPLNRVGRPLGMATASTTVALPSGGAWAFQTTTVNDLGVDYAAYPAFSD